MLPLVLLVPLYLASQLGDNIYATGAVSQAISSIFLIGPAVAAWGAWRASILWRGRVADLAPARPRLRIVARALTPVLLGGWGVLALAIVWALVWARLAPEVSGDPRADLWVVAMGAAVLAGHATIGYAVGARLSPIVAIPGVFIFLYLWMVFPPAWEPLWLRHLTGFVDGRGCCGPASEWDPGAIAAPAIIASGSATASLLVAGEGIRLAVRAAVALSIVAAAGVTGASLVWHLDADPARPRTPAALECIDGPPRVCVWPEHHDRIQEVLDLASQTEAALERWGIGVPPLVTEGTNDSEYTAHRLVIQLHPLMTREQVHAALIASMVPDYLAFSSRGYGSADHESDCPAPDPRRAPEDQLWAWLAVHAEFDLEEPWGLGPADSVELRAIFEQPPSQQREWYQQRRDDLEACAATRDTQL